MARGVIAREKGWPIICSFIAKGGLFAQRTRSRQLPNKQRIKQKIKRSSHSEMI
jgi:hypothetical protein